MNRSPLRVAPRPQFAPLLRTHCYGVQHSAFVAAIWAFLGAMIWSMQNIFRRMINLDLFPGVFYSVAIRMILACFVGILVWYLFLSMREVVGVGVSFVTDAASGTLMGRDGGSRPSRPISVP